MKLVLQRIRLPLAHFELEVDAEITQSVVALFGPSGAGKTSLLDLLAGLRRAPSAFISLDGQVLTDTATRREVPTRARRIGYVPQDGALFPHYSVRQNLLYGCHGHAGHDADRELTIENVAAVLEIQQFLDRGIGRLSGGEKQRVALARALLSSPRLLLLDEPMTGLDFDLKARVVEYLQRIRDEFKVPMVYVTHNLEEVFALCDELLVLERGRVVGQGRPQELFTVSRELTYRLKRPDEVTSIAAVGPFGEGGSGK
ncbi:MAG TPA: ATP-binding cassette domain-containing protein [Thermoanaerobaculia bacterium]|jgi:molybdate transport system ATP-binding protein|nr:ATP-binding cassette domain-containing protein [Thermoanaerobaculia bacterium]